MRPLEGTAALVTGAARGIGRQYALTLAELGAAVVVADRDLRSYAEFRAEADAMGAENTAAEIRARGGRAVEVEFDVTDRDAVVAAAADVTRALDAPVTVLVCNAGGGTGTPETTRASALSDDDVQQVLQRNYVGTVNTVAAFTPGMIAAGTGRIITVSSQAGLRPGPGGGYAHYGSVKAAIVMYTQYLAQDLGPYGITANCIAPGYIATGRLAGVYEQLGEDSFLDQIALGRFGSPEDCAALVGFLSTPAAAYITGATIPIDGGLIR